MKDENNSVSEFQLLTDNKDPDEVVKLSFSQRRKLILTIVILVVVIVLLCIGLLSVFFTINKKCNENEPKGKIVDPIGIEGKLEQLPECQIETNGECPDKISHPISTISCRTKLDKKCMYICHAICNSDFFHELENSPWILKFDNALKTEEIVLSQTWNAVIFQMKLDSTKTIEMAVGPEVDCTGFLSPLGFRLSITGDAKSCPIKLTNTTLHKRVKWENCSRMIFNGRCNYEITVVNNFFNYSPFIITVNRSRELFHPSWLTMYNTYNLNASDIKVGRMLVPHMTDLHYNNFTLHDVMVPVRNDHYTPIGSKMVWVVNDLVKSAYYHDKNLEVCYIFNLNFTSQDLFGGT